jgi:two-component system NtrC family sensor kinase
MTPNPRGPMLSVRARLLAMVLSPTLIALPIIIGLLAYWGNSYYDRLMVYKIASDLAVANQYLDRVLATIGTHAAALADSARLAEARADPQAAARLLADSRQRLGFDFIFLLDAKGRVTASSGGPGASLDQAFWPVVGAALEGRAHSGIDVFSPDQLAAIDEGLARRAGITVVATRNAAPDAKRDERRGMVIHAAAPVRDAAGRVVGAIEAGVLLNGNLDIVDRINDIVYQPASLPLGSRGTATLFLDDVRIATNVRLFENQRALGTRVSLAVRDQVLGEGRTWLDKAFVVNDWYVSGYEPLYDTFQRRVGMLYVGFLEAPFRQAKYAGLGVMAAVFALLAAAATVFFLRWARTIFDPLERMNRTMNAVESGDAGARVGETGRGDEIGALARRLDQLLDTLQAQADALRALNADLDRKVVERTAQLETAQRQLARADKLAALGELTAGVAHEINNPIAVMQGNLDLLRAELGPAAAPVAQEVRLLDQQIDRVRLIVAKLLQFARPGEYAGYIEDVAPNALVADSLVLVRHMLGRGGIEVRQALHATRTVRIAPTELQQVLINLMVNAIHAMPRGGTLSLETADWSAHGVAIVVGDTGVGIRSEDLERIFDPFFTTRKHEGTGLGLSISYAILERYGATLTVESEPGQGARFTIRLLSEPQLDAPAAPAAAGGAAARI